MNPKKRLCRSGLFELRSFRKNSANPTIAAYQIPIGSNAALARNAEINTVTIEGLQ